MIWRWTPAPYFSILLQDWLRVQLRLSTEVSLKHFCFSAWFSLPLFLAFKNGQKTRWASCLGYTRTEGCAHIAVRDMAPAYSGVNLARSSDSRNNMVALALCRLYRQVCHPEEACGWLTWKPSLHHCFRWCCPDWNSCRYVPMCCNHTPLQSHPKT